jgi:hypothetical protein
MTKERLRNTLSLQHPFTMTLALLPVACNRTTTTTKVVHRITMVQARTLTSKASLDRHRGNMVNPKDHTVASRCSTNKDRHHQADTIRMTGGRAAEAAGSLLDCARVWHAVVVWTAYSKLAATVSNTRPKDGTGWNGKGEI